MKILTAVSALALVAFTAPALAQSNSLGTSGPGTNSSQPSGQPGATGGTDPKQGGMSEGRGSAMDRNGGMRNGSTDSGYNNGNMAPGGGPGVHD